MLTGPLMWLSSRSKKFCGNGAPASSSKSALSAPPPTDVTPPVTHVLWICTDDAPVAFTGPWIVEKSGPPGVSVPTTNTPLSHTLTGPLITMGVLF